MDAKSALYQPMSVPETFVESMTNDIKVMINLLDAEVQNPQMLHGMIEKFIEGIIVHRETRTVHITIHLKIDDHVLYQKTIVADWDLMK